MPMIFSDVKKTFLTSEKNQIYKKEENDFFHRVDQPGNRHRSGNVSFKLLLSPKNLYRKAFQVLINQKK